MKPPSLPSLALVGVAGLFCAGSYGVRSLLVRRTDSSPRLAELRTEEALLAGNSDQAVRAAEVKLAELRKKLWTQESFAAWCKANVPEGWIVQHLEADGPAHAHSRRYAFQRPNASNEDWPEILSVLGRLEEAPCVSVQSAALGVPAGYAESRHFAQCLLIAIFYFRQEIPAPTG